MNRSTLSTPLNPQVTGSVLRDALADFDALTVRQEETELDFFTGDDEELTPDESGW